MRSHAGNHVQSEDATKRSSRNHTVDISINKTPVKHESSARLCTFKRDNAGYGFKITGNAPVKVQAVRIDGVAWISGLRENDVILKVNGISVVDKEHAVVVALIRKEIEVKLLVKSEQLIKNPNSNNSSQKRKPSPSTAAPLYDSNISLPNSQPIPTPRPKTIQQSHLPKPTNNNSTPRNNKTSIEIKEPKNPEDHDDGSDSPDTSSGDSMVTSSVESEPPKKGPPKTRSSFPTTPLEPHNAMPGKSNSYNGPSKAAPVATNNVPFGKKQSLESLKSKSYPPNGAKSVNGILVTDKQAIEVAPNVKKDPKGKLVPELDSSHKITKAASSSPKTKPPSRTGVPPVETAVPKPSTLPKFTKRPKSAHENQIKVATNNNPTSRHKDLDMKEEVAKDRVDKTECSDSSSGSSEDTSSSESESPHKWTSKSVPPSSRSAIDSHNDPSIKSNPINAPIALVDDIQATSNHESIYATMPKKAHSKYLAGLDFDEDTKDDEESDASISLVEMLSSTKDALSNPGLVALLLSYVKEKFDDLKIMILYYNCKLYKSLILRREFPAESRRMANEIITTFLLEKSPLYTVINIEAINEALRILEGGENIGAVFDSIINNLYDTLTGIIEKICGKITRGIQFSEDVSFFVSSIHSNLNQEKEISLLHRAMFNIISKNQKEFPVSDIILATHIGLATMYQYFHKSNFQFNSSIRAKSSDSLNVAQYQAKTQNISDLFNIKTLCAPYQPKGSSVLRKKTKSVSGHVLIYTACQFPRECNICDQLLWGTSPQGLFCTMCETYYHDLCRKKIKTPCSKKLKKSSTRVNREEKPPFFERLSRKSSTNSVKSVNITGDNVNNGGNYFFNEGPILPDDKTSGTLNGDNNELLKSQSGDPFVRMIDQSFRRLAMGNDRNLSLVNQSMDNGILPSDQCVVDVQELVKDTSIDDPDMKMEESFDAEFEIKSVFPNINPQSNKKRLIVLLEFYHKTRYILMNLKRFQYCLVNKWPQSQRVYSKALSLDCVDPFVNLIKSLVITIRNCINDQDFNGLERVVLNWLSENDDDRVKEWITLSSNLCCTNSLNHVKQLKQTTLRAIPELTDLLKAKFHKLVIIEELSQIRPLLISLPFIAKNIIKCLTKEEPLYSEELAVWTQVSTKMDYICEYIDRCSIPLVDWINKGIIIKRSERFDFPTKSKDSEKEIKDFCLDFPRTFFHFPIFDFQFAKIMTWYTNSRKADVETHSTYLKNGTDVLLICYKNFIVILQKENDHYVLKPIKPLKNTSEIQPPIIDIRGGIIVTKGGQEESQFVLNFICQEPDNVFLLRIGFPYLEVVESWLEYIEKNIYDLSRSIRLFKMNDLGSVPEASSHFMRTPSGTSIKSKSSADLIDSGSIASICPEIIIKKPKENLAHYISLSETLTRASEALDSTSSICSMLNVPKEDLPSQMKILTEDGIKTDEELIALLYNLSQTTIRQTHQLLAKTCPKVELNGNLMSSEITVNEFRQTLEATSRLLDKWQNSGTTEPELIPEVALRVKSLPKLSDGTKPEVPVRVKPSSHANHSQRYSVDLDLLVKSSEYEDIKFIVDDIIEKALKKVRSPDTNRDSYKYVPSDVQLPSIDDRTYLSEAAITPTYAHLNSVVEETITTRTAQIVLHNRSSGTASG